MKVLLAAITEHLARCWHSIYLKHYKKLTLIISALFLGMILLFGWMSAQKVKEVVLEDFNQQQLVLSRHAASQIENSLNLLRRELLLLSLSPSMQYSEAVFMGKRMMITFSSIKDEGGVRIKYVEEKTYRVHLADADAYRIDALAHDDLDYLEWARKKENKGTIAMSDIAFVDCGEGQRLIMKMATPVWQSSVDESHRIPTNKFAGVLIFAVDVTALAQKVMKGIQSGKTGYSWVIDHDGTFIYHPERVFVGKNAFEVRKERKPTISYARINEIQKERMLKGQEGTSWYISGWHRGKEEEMRKLIAYSPIRLDATREASLWSVAVVAPVSEVEGVIHSIQVRQFWLQGVGILVIISSGLLIMSIMLRWSSSLKREVQEKTSELRKREYQYRSLVEHADDIIFTLSREGHVLSMNRYGYQFFQKRPDKVLGEPIADLFSCENAELVVRAIYEVFDTNTSKQVTCSVRRGEQVSWLSINFSGLVDESGGIHKVLGIGRDITERMSMHEQMCHTEKLASMGTLAAGVAHEINNPLAIILGFTDLLLEKAPTGSDEHDMLKTIEKQGLNAKRVVENLLSFARRTEHREENVDVNKSIEEVLAVVGNTLSVNKIKLVKNLARDLPAARGEPEEFQQVFINIINNAVAAMKKGGVLTVATRMVVDEGRGIEVRIADTGTGIRKEHRSRIFDPLFTTKKVGEGTGLGLSVSYGIVTKYGGSITFRTKTADEARETGTTFIVTLPAIT